MKHYKKYLIGAIVGALISGIILPSIFEKQAVDFIISESRVPGEDRMLYIIGNGKPVGFGPQKITIAVAGVRSELTTNVWNDGGEIVPPKITWNGKVAHITVSGCEQEDVEYTFNCEIPNYLSINIHENY